jgi:hypothetical protein
MKKIISLLLIVCMLTIGATSAFAGSDSDSYHYNYTAGTLLVMDYYDNGTHYVETRSDCESDYYGCGTSIFSALNFSQEAYIIDTNGTYNLIGSYDVSLNGPDDLQYFGNRYYQYYGLYEIPSNLDLPGAQVYVANSYEALVTYDLEYGYMDVQYYI